MNQSTLVKQTIIDPIEEWISELSKRIGSSNTPVGIRSDLRYLEVYTPVPNGTWPTKTGLCHKFFPKTKFRTHITTEEYEKLPSLLACITLQKIAVQPAHRRKGIASFIIDSIIDLANHSPCYHLVCVESVVSSEMESLMNQRPEFFVCTYETNTYYTLVSS